MGNAARGLARHRKVLFRRRRCRPSCGSERRPGDAARRWLQRQRPVNRLYRLAFVVLLLVVATAATAEPLANVPHPALWHVQGAKGELYLFGSIHILPTGLDWQKDVIADAIHRSDVFVFEIPLDESAQARLGSLIDDRGRLPKGQSLRGMLSPAAQAD